MTKISIIIPILNEVDAIHRLLLHIEQVVSKTLDYEIIVVDGGSSDGSQKCVKDFEKVILIEAEKGRAKQMNSGAKNAKGEIVYFLHCDSFPPKNFDVEIAKQINQGNLAGCFRLKFDYSHPVLLVSQWFTRFNHISCRGGDQSLFVTKNLFDEIGGFDEKYSIYEDNEIIKRLYQKKQFTVIPKHILTSARRYHENGVWRLQYHFSVIHLKRKLGHSVESMLNYYKKNVK
jgi:rSAM/selenodomain-associated transferase 2